MPELIPGNVPIIEMFQQTQNQMIFAPNGRPIDADFKALDGYLDRQGIEGVEVFNKVVMCIRHWIRIAWAER